MLQVTDTGRGIAVDDQARLFEPFYRAGPQAGAGLGLSIVKHLVELMNGQIEVSSEIDRGTTVRVVLPLIEPHA
jgi:signal transduction histidine kinase